MGVLKAMIAGFPEQSCLQKTGCLPTSFQSSKEYNLHYFENKEDKERALKIDVGWACWILYQKLISLLNYFRVHHTGKNFLSNTT